MWELARARVLNPLLYTTLTAHSQPSLYSLEIVFALEKPGNLLLPHYKNTKYPMCQSYLLNTMQGNDWIIEYI